MKRILSLSAVTLLSAGCSTPQPCVCAPQGAKSAALAAPARPIGAAPGWSSYRDFKFEYNLADILVAGPPAGAEIAAYVAAHPSLTYGIDGSMDAYGKDPHDQKLTDLRVLAVRNALIAAGVPGEKIITGPFGDPQLTRDRRIAVLVSTR